MTKILATLFAVLLAFSTHAATQNDEAHSHGAHGDAVIAPPKGQLWPTDEHLRAGMTRIESALGDVASKQTIERASALDLAGIVESNVKYIIEHCALPPEPDAALHVLIGRLMTAAHRLKNESSPEPAIQLLKAVLHDYRATFDHELTSTSGHTHSHRGK